MPPISYKNIYIFLIAVITVLLLLNVSSLVQELLNGTSSVSCDELGGSTDTCVIGIKTNPVEDSAWCLKNPSLPVNSTLIRRQIDRGEEFAITVYQTGDFVSRTIIDKNNGWEPKKTRHMIIILRQVAQERGVPPSEVTFVDIGANIGWFTMVMASHGFQVLAFEPMPQNDLLIRHTLCNNPKLAKSIVYYNTGLSDQASKCIMYSDEGNFGDGHVSCKDDFVLPDKYAFRGTIYSDRLDKFIAPKAGPAKASAEIPHDTSRIGLVKIDVEGFEAHVLAGGEDVLLHGGIPYIIMEFAPFMLEEKGSDPRAFIMKILDAGTYDIHVESIYSPVVRSVDHLFTVTYARPRTIKDLFLVAKTAVPVTPSTRYRERSSSDTNSQSNPPISYGSRFGDTADNDQRTKDYLLDAVSTQEEFCSRDNNAVPSTATIVKKQLDEGKSLSMYVYKREDFVSQEIISQSKGWDPQKTQEIVSLLGKVAEQRGVLNRDVTFVDIGANVGWFTMIMASHGFKVLAFEPMPQNDELIRRTLCLNPRLAKSIVYYNYGLSDQKSKCVIYSSENNVGDGHLNCEVHMQLPRHYEMRGVVLSDRLDKFIAPKTGPAKASAEIPHDTSRIGVVKIDVEGFEAHVLAGGEDVLLHGGIPYIIMEFSPRMMQEKGSDPRAFIQKILDAGTYDIHVQSIQSPAVTSVEELMTTRYPQMSAINDLFLVAKDMAGSSTMANSSSSSALTTPAPFIASTSEWKYYTEAMAKQETFCQTDSSVVPDTEMVTRQIEGGERFKILAYKDRDMVSINILGNSYGWNIRKTQSMLSLLKQVAKDRRVGHNRVTFVDIGAHIGWFTMVMASHGFKVLAFEPMPQNDLLIRHTLCLNPTLSKSIVYYNHGLSDRETNCTIYSDDYDLGGGNIKCQAEFSLPPRRSVRGQIHSDRLDRFLVPRTQWNTSSSFSSSSSSSSSSSGPEQHEEYTPPHDVLSIGLVKIDVEGFEGFVLNGGEEILFRSHIPFIVAEFAPFLLSDKGHDPRQFIQKLLDVGTYDIHIGSVDGPLVSSVVNAFSTVFREENIVRDLYMVYKNGTVSSEHELSDLTTGDAEESSESVNYYKQAMISQQRFCKHPKVPSNPVTSVERRSGRGQPFQIYLYRDSDIVSNVITKRMLGWDPMKSIEILSLLSDVAKARGVPNSEVTFVDIGANVGWFTMVMASHGFKVLAFEPMPQNDELIRRTLCENPELAKSVVYYNYGLSDQKTKCVMYSDEGNFGDGHMNCDLDFEVPDRYVLRGNIVSDRLDQFIAPVGTGRSHIPHDTSDIGVVKIDVEGFESFVFNGGEDVLLHGGIPYIITEFAPYMFEEQKADPRAFIQKILDARTYSIHVESTDGLRIRSVDHLFSVVYNKKRVVKDLYLVSKRISDTM